MVSGEHPSFPLRIGAIDVGSNALRLQIAEFQSPTQYTIVTSERAAVRLGRDVFLTSRLNRVSQDAAIAALVGFRERLQRFGARYYRAVATCAVRESSNQAEFVNRVLGETGISLDVIDGSEETRLIFLAVRNSFDLGANPSVLVDVGGGSVEVALVDRNEIVWSQSHTMGTVRILEELNGAAKDPGRLSRLVEEYVATLQIPLNNDLKNKTSMIATGGNIEALARLAKTIDRNNNSDAISLSSLRLLISILAKLTYSQRMTRFDLRADRADVILPAALIYESICALTGAANIRTPKVGVKEGVLFDIIDDLLTHPVHIEKQALNLTMATRHTFGDNIEEKKGARAASIALDLFDHLVPRLGLAAEDRRFLQAAGCLLDIDTPTSGTRRHEYSYDVTSWPELQGLSPHDFSIAATITRHFRCRQREDDVGCVTPFSTSDWERIRRLSTLLRVAQSLNQEPGRPLERAKVVNSDLVFHLSNQNHSDMIIEGWAIQGTSGPLDSKFGQDFDSSLPGEQ